MPLRYVRGERGEGRGEKERREEGKRGRESVEGRVKKGEKRGEELTFFIIYRLNSSTKHSTKL